MITGFFNRTLLIFSQFSRACENFLGKSMSKHRKPLNQSPLFQTKLSKFINTEHRLVELANSFNWERVDQLVTDRLSQEVGRPMMQPRLMVGLFLLKHLDNLSDETLIQRFIENPYYQYFCGLTYFSHEVPCDPTTIVKWRKKLGASFFEEILKETIFLALKSNALSEKDLLEVYVDTTVQEKTIQFPTDTRLYLKAIRVLNRLASKHSIKPKQSYKFTAPKLALKQSRYAHAKQMKRARKCTKKLKTSFGRLLRDLQRKFRGAKIDGSRSEKVFELCRKLYNQKKSDKNKIYSLHAPEVKCISKGKAHKRYEFGNKVSIATTVAKNFIVGALSFSENMYDGKTLKPSLDQVSKIAGCAPNKAYVDRGYRGYTSDQGDIAIFHQAQRKGLSPRTKRLLKQRSRIEPVIGHLKDDHRLGRNFLLGTDGDEINVILAAVAFNLRKLLRCFFVFFNFRMLKSNLVISVSR